MQAIFCDLCLKIELLFFAFSKLFLNRLPVTTLLGNSKGPVELGNSNNCAEAKLCLFLFTSALEIVSHKTEVFKTVSSG